MDLFVALIVIGLGALALFVGFRLFVVLLPIWGFFVGFALGASLMANWLGEGFLGSVLAIVVGAVVAIGFALIAYLWWWAGVVIAIGAFGFAIGYAILPAIGLDNAEFLSFLLGLAGAVAFGLAAVVLRLPRLLVIVVTSLWGAGAVIGGVMIFLNMIEVEQLGRGVVDRAVSDSFFWLIAYVALAVVGMVAQLTTSDEIVLGPPGSEDNLRTGPPDPRLA